MLRRILLVSIPIILGAVFLISAIPGAAVDSTPTPESTLQPPRVRVKTLLPTQTIAPSQTPQIRLTETPAEVFILTNTIPPFPAEHYIENITGHRQFFAIGCETSAAVDWAKYFGLEINEFNFQYELPKSDNPDYGFVGSVEGPWGQAPPYAYGVHAGPIADLLNQYGINAKAVKGYSLEELKQQIAAEKPVIAWVIGNVVGGVPMEYTDSQGRTTIVAAYEHVVIVTGYSEDKIRYLNNGNFYEAPTEVFLNSWEVLGNMVVYLED